MLGSNKYAQSPKTLEMGAFGQKENAANLDTHCIKTAVFFGGAKGALCEQEPDEPQVFAWLPSGGPIATLFKPVFTDTEI